MNKEKDDGTALGFSASELRTLPTENLLQRLTNTREGILNLNTGAAVGLYGRKRHSNQPHFYSGYRRAIARVLTVLGERGVKL